MFNAAAISLPFLTTVVDEHVLGLTSNSFDDAVGKDKAALVDNKIVKKKSHFEIDIKWLKSILVKEM